MSSALDTPRLHRVRPDGLVPIVAAIAGTAVSVYLTVEHYSDSASFACPESVKVTTSKWSVIAGVPVAVLGLAYFVVMLGLLAAPRSHSHRRDATHNRRRRRSTDGALPGVH